MLGHVEFEKCAIFDLYYQDSSEWLGLVEFEKCAIL